MTRVFVLLVGLAGCANRAILPVPPKEPTTMLPILHLACAPPALPPSALPPVRTVAELGQWGIAQSKARALTAARLQTCAANLQKVEEWAQQKLR